MMMLMEIPSFLFEHALAGILDAGDGPVLTQFRAGLEDHMDKAMLDGLASELNDFIKLFDPCFQSTPSR